MIGLRDPHIAVHGSFSLMVNYEAICQYMEFAGGFSLRTAYQDGFKVVCSILGAGKHSLPELNLAFQTGMQYFGPDNFSTLQRTIKSEVTSPSVKMVISLLRLSGHDPDIFYKFKHHLLDKVCFPNASDKLQKDIKQDLIKVYENYYVLSKHKDVAFEIGRMFMSLKDYRGAMPFFRDSLDQCGDHHVTHYNLGLCFNYVDDFEEALKCFNRSLELSQMYPEAIEWKRRVLLKMGHNTEAPEPPDLGGIILSSETPHPSRPLGSVPDHYDRIPPQYQFTPQQYRQYLQSRNMFHTFAQSPDANNIFLNPRNFANMSPFKAPESQSQQELASGPSARPSAISLFTSNGVQSTGSLPPSSDQDEVVPPVVDSERVNNSQG